MVVLKREMNSTENYISQTYNNKCQASINSDGTITLRIYDVENEEKDEIIILSEDETNAIFDLMNMIDEKKQIKILFLRGKINEKVVKIARYKSNQHHTKVETSEYELYKKFKDKYNIKDIKGLEVNDNWL